MDTGHLFLAAATSATAVALSLSLGAGTVAFGDAALTAPGT